MTIRLDSTLSYRKPVRRRIRQGDIALAEFHQLRSPSGSERKGPGGQSYAAPNLPYLGEPSDYKIEIGEDGGTRLRTLRVWEGFVIVIHQACEMEFADAEDSRLIVAPLVTPERWPEGPWDLLRKDLLPGYFYLPEAPEGGDLGLDEEWPESVAVLASTTCLSDGLVRGKRLLSLPGEGIIELQDSLSKFFGVRGFASVREAGNLIGKRLVSYEETGQVVHGPSMLLKAAFADEGVNDDRDDEVTVAYWGVRPAVRND